MKVFLDDVRSPSECVSYMYKRIGSLNPIYLEEWKVVRNYNDFIKVIRDNDTEITHISFDHDLGEDVAENLVNSGFSKRKARASKKLVASGYDAAKWLKDWYTRRKLELPIMFVHSMNPIGTQNIINLFNNKK